ncbi:MAG: hypothetical protein FD123_2249 [Bacteroidetes bacterium]|nr:MAG: hypothetical protein FD123_2249 [Bacteroidota bacterium]
MDKVLKIVRLKDKQSDYAYWYSKTPQERLAAIELLRQQYMELHKGIPLRLQRICRIINKVGRLKDQDDLEDI